MRLTHVDLFTNETEFITFSVKENDRHAKYQVRSIFGLDTDEIIHKFYGFGAGSSTPRFYNFVLKAREIAIRAVLNPNFRNTESYSDIRDSLYRAISANRQGIITLHFHAGATTVAKIEGFITKFEVPYFSQLPEVQITIKCDDPMFRGIAPIRYETDELASVSPIIVADSYSTAPHGFTMDVQVVTEHSGIIIGGTDEEWEFEVVPDDPFEVDDIIHFSSEYSDKHIWVERGATRIDLANFVTPESMWPLIFPGANEFTFEEFASFNINFIEYYPAYWGV